MSKWQNNYHASTQSDYEIDDETIKLFLTKIINAKNNHTFPTIYSDTGKEYALQGIGKKGIACCEIRNGEFYPYSKTYFSAQEVAEQFSTYMKVNGLKSNEPVVTISVKEYEELKQYKLTVDQAHQELNESVGKINDLL